VPGLNYRATYRRTEVRLFEFLTSVPDEARDQLHASAAIPPEKQPRYSVVSKLRGPQS
jgi:hypothetical protein